MAFIMGDAINCCVYMLFSNGNIIQYLTKYAQHPPLKSSRTDTHKPPIQKTSNTPFLTQFFSVWLQFSDGNDLWRLLWGKTCLVLVATLAYGSWDCSTRGHAACWRGTHLTDLQMSKWLPAERTINANLWPCHHAAGFMLGFSEVRRRTISTTMRSREGTRVEGSKEQEETEYNAKYRW